MSFYAKLVKYYERKREKINEIVLVDSEPKSNRSDPVLVKFNAKVFSLV